MDAENEKPNGEHQEEIGHEEAAESSWTWASLIGWTKPLLALFSLAVVAFGFSAGRSALRDQFVRQNPSELSITPSPTGLRRPAPPPSLSRPLIFPTPARES